MENHTAKHFVLQLGSLVSLYLSVTFLLVLLFGIINLAYPDPAEGSWAVESASSSVRIGIAMVLVFFPTYLILTRIVNKTRRQEETGAYLGLTKWLIYLSLLVGGIAILVDLVIVINTFLEGELTQRFLLKAVAVLGVVGIAVHYYVLDAKGFWLKNEAMSIYYAIGAGLIALVSVGYGFAYIETPAEVRERNLDASQVMDLQNIQYQIESYISLRGEVPTSLEEVARANGVPLMMEAPEGREAYTYEVTENGFRLCATFAAATPADEYSVPYYIDESSLIKNRDNWSHGEGRYCFERVVR
jgi:hypothetical protein